MTTWPQNLSEISAREFRFFAHQHGAAQGFTTPIYDPFGAIVGYQENLTQDAFRHGFSTAFLYVHRYQQVFGLTGSETLADFVATNYALGLGALNEWWGANTLQQHLRDVWNNYEGLQSARDFVAATPYVNGGFGTNSDLADFIGARINASLAAPIGQSQFIFFDGVSRNNPTHDPRIDVATYPTARLPTLLVPRVIIQAFPGFYGQSVVTGAPCFSSGTPILLSDWTVRPIEQVAVGDNVLAFDKMGDLRPARVTQLIPGFTAAWIELEDGTRVTPGHRYLRPDGTFEAIADILANDGIVVDAEGRPTQVVGQLIRAADTHSGAEWITPEPFVSGNIIVKTNPILGWRTYNFTVEPLHTYVAGGYRVHNEGCLQDGDVISDFVFNEQTGSITWLGMDQHGNSLAVTDILTDAGDFALVERSVRFDSNDAVVRTTWTDFDEDNSPVGEPQRDVTFPNVAVSGEQIGSIFGASLGQLIGGGDVFARVAAGSALSALLGNVGESLHIYFNDTRSLSDPNSPSLILGQAADAAFGDFSADLANAFRTQGIGAVSAFLTGELAEALGFNGTSFADQLLRATSSTLINTAINNVASGIGLFNGISGLPGTSIASFVGSYLAHEIYAPTTLGGAIGSQIGSSLGVLGASSLIGSVGTQVLASLAIAQAFGAASSIILGALTAGIGAFVGALIGTWLGEVFSGLFGQPEPHWAIGSSVLTPGAQRFSDSAVTANYGDVATMVGQVRSAATHVLNAYLDAIGGEVVANASVYASFHSTSEGPGEQTTIGGLRLTGDTDAAQFIAYHEGIVGGTTAQRKINVSVINTLKQLDIAGGNLYIKRAIANSSATTLEQLSGEIKIAEDYGRYLANKDIIDALIAQNPNSAFAAGWIVTLLRAEELGITYLNQTDFDGGIARFLQSFDVQRLGATLADVSLSFQGNSIVLTIAQGAGQQPRQLEIWNYAQMTGLGSVVGSAVNGNGTNELWFGVDGVNSSFYDVSQHFDTLSNDVLIGGSGHDTIVAGVGADLIYGRGGHDWIDAGTGHDIISGGAGNDTIEGGTGDDVFAFNRGDGTDTIRDHGVVIARDVLNPNYQADDEGEGGGGGDDEEEEGEGGEGGEDPEDALFQPYSSPIAVGTVISGGSDALAFGQGISVDDLIVRFQGNDLVVAIRDPAHPTWGFDQLTDKIRLTNWLDARERVETFQFTDGTSLGVGGIALLADPSSSVVAFSDISWSADGLYGSAVAQVAVGTNASETLYGSGNSGDALAGNGGNDWLDGGAGADLMAGGTGIDTYVVDDASDRVVEAAGAGTDTVRTALASYALAANVENLVGTAVSGQTLTGNNLDNSITGGAGNDTLNGGFGHDVLDGGAGQDTMVGGLGNDTYVVDNAGDVVTEASGAGTDTVRTTLASYVLAANVENLVGTATSGQTLTGNALANSIIGGAGVDTVVFSGNRSDYAISYDAPTKTFTIADQRAGAPDGTDKITNVEQIQFADQTVATISFDQAPTAATLSNDTIAENLANGTVIGVVTGVDPDAGSTLSYSLLDTAGGRFAINAATGQLTVANSALLDFEGSASHEITVRVADELGRNLDKAFTINLTDVQEAPNSATLSGNTIAENSANGMVVGTVTGFDQDAGTTLSYSLIDSAGGRFAIDAANGQLTVGNGSLLDYDTIPSHAITVRVTDQTGLYLDKAFTINLTNVNETPTDATLSRSAIVEHPVNGTVVGTVAGADPDAGTTFNYSLLDDAGGRFAVNATTGQLTVANPALLDHANAASHAIMVRAADEGGLFVDKAFTINVVQNGAPSDAALAGGVVAENVANGTVVGAITGVDTDPGGTLSYALTNNAGGRFAIDAVTGQLTVTNGSLLNYESATSHAITVRVTDQGGLTLDKSLAINVSNVNEAPTNATLSANSVYENAANGTYIGTVAGTDPDAGATFSYSLINGASGRFAINATTGQLTVANGALLDFEAAPSHAITVRVTDQGGLTFDKAFTVTLSNLNEAPIDAILGGGVVSEDMPDGAVIGTVLGVDPDAGATLTYSIVNNPSEPVYAIDATTGRLTVLDAADVDEEDPIIVRVTDQGGLSFDKAFFIREVESAVVNYAPYSISLSGGSVAENAVNGTTIGTLTGYDPNAASVLSYALIASAGGRFAINGSSGRLTVANGALLNYEGGTSHGITVRVTDEYGATFDQSFTIGVANVNEAPTGATLTGGTVAENAANGTVVGTVAGADPDAGATFSYSLTNDAGARFAINANTGQLTVRDGSVLNYEGATSHGITVRVTDQGGLTFDRNFTIQVSDVNESPPTNATLVGGSVAENAGNGTTVGTISGSDPDGTAVLSYSLTDNAGGRFAINATTGVLTVANGALLDRESATSHSITVRVIDQGGLTFDKGFTIAVSNVNEAPTNATLSGGTVAENAPNGTVVGTVAGVDPDAGATFSYALTNDAGGRFAIDANTGHLTVANGSLLNYESATSHAITVRVTDQGGLTFDKALTINLTDVNETPTGATLTGGTVAENATNGTVVGTVAGIDPDAGATFSYSLTDDAGGRFAIDADTGGLTVLDGSLLNYEGATSHGITVRVTDQGGLTFDRSFTIQLSDANESPPTDATLVGGSVAENAANGTTVGTISGSDPDGTAVLSYSLTDNAGGRFAINATTGVLTVANGALLDHESATSHSITVQMTDQGGLTFDKGFIIAVSNLNEAPTNATLSGGTVAENAANDTVVGTVTGADPDASATLSYSLTDSAGGRFGIDTTTGELTVANGSLLDYDTAASHAITVRVTDQGGLTFDKALTINLTDANETPTGATLTGGTVAENAANGTVVGTVIGIDPDAGATFSYSLTNDAGGRFAIDADTGQLTVLDGSLLNYEGATSHGITVRVTDQAGLTFDKSLTIHLSDVNESPPTDATLTGDTIAENAANGTTVGTVTGVDPDGSAVLSYSLTDSAGGRFAINATTGVLTVANSSLLDYESAASHSITVRVTDQGGLTFDKGFAVGVTNVNDAPTNASLSGSTIAENAANGTVVGTVTGTDPDAGATFSYSLTNNAGGRFAIGATTGQVTVANGSLLDFESATSHGITVRVADQGGLTIDKAFQVGVTNVPGITTAGTSGNDTQTGTGEEDTLQGAGGDDTLTGGGGNDILNGGAGSDTAVYSGNRAAYVLNYNAATQTFTITDQRAGTPDGADTVTGVEWFRFSDGSLNYDAQGRLISQTVVNADGSKTTTAYDPANTQSWSSYVTRYNASGAAVSQEGNYDNGGHWINYWDVANAYSYSMYSDTYDASWRRTSQTGDYDNGGHWVYSWDVTNAYSYSMYLDTYDAYWRRTSQTGDYDHGGHWVISWDVANAYSYSTYTDIYDASWNRMSQVGDYDDGTHWGIFWDTTNSYSYSVYTNYYNASWVLTAQYGTYDDGSTWSYIPGGGPGGGPPVILDLDGNGVDITQLPASSARFDMNGDGRRDATAWVGKGDAFLAIDLGEEGRLGADGVIDQTKEIVFTAWAPETTSDMAALRQVFDSNHDGLLDQGDEHWNSFRVWQDQNQDGISQTGELRTLNEAGIRSIDLRPTGNATSFADGSAITGTSAYIRTNGTTGIAGDVSLAYQASLPSVAMDTDLARLVQAMASYATKGVETHFAAISSHDGSPGPTIANPLHS